MNFGTRVSSSGIFARWVSKAQQLQTMGHFVFTLPEAVRGRYRSKASLDELTKRVTAGDKSRHIKGSMPLLL